MSLLVLGDVVCTTATITTLPCVVMAMERLHNYRRRTPSTIQVNACRARTKCKCHYVVVMAVVA